MTSALFHAISRMPNSRRHDALHERTAIAISLAVGAAPLNLRGAEPDVREAERSHAENRADRDEESGHWCSLRSPMMLAATIRNPARYGQNTVDAASLTAKSSGANAMRRMPISRI